MDVTRIKDFKSSTIDERTSSPVWLDRSGFFCVRFSANQSLALILSSDIQLVRILDSACLW